MDFNQLIFEKIYPLLGENNFSVSTIYKNYLKFQSDSLEITFSYNELDRLSLFEIGKKDNSLYPITDTVLRNVFGSDIKLDLASMEVFVDNVLAFLKNEGKSIFNDNTTKIIEIAHFIEKESATYTSRLLLKQSLAALDKAWDTKNYKEFIKLAERNNIDQLPNSYQLKYKIAHQKAL